MTLMTISEFLAGRTMGTETMRSRLTSRKIHPAVRRGASLGGHLYRFDDLLHAYYRQSRLLPKRRTDWVKAAPGDRIRVTNVAGRTWVGIFGGYKGDVLGILKFQEDELLFGIDAKISPASSHDQIDRNSGIHVQEAYDENWKEIYHMGKKQGKGSRYNELD